MSNLKKIIPELNIIKRTYNLLEQDIRRKQDLSFYNVFNTGSRASGKTYKTMEFIKNILKLDNVKTSVFWVNGKIEQCNSSYKEFLNKWALKYWDPEKKEYKTTLKEMNFNFKNGNTLQMVNIINQEKEASDNNGFYVAPELDYMVVVVEEAQRLNKDNVANFFGSLRSDKKTRMLFIYISNPINANDIQTKQAIEICKPDLATLKRDGFMFNEVVKDYFGIKKRTISIWSNWIINRENLADDYIIFLKQEIQNNPLTADWKVWGYPYSKTGKLFNGTAKAVKVEYDLKHFKHFDKINIGLDVADGLSSSSAHNTIVFNCYNEKANKYVILSSYIEDKERDKWPDIKTKAKFFLKLIDTFKHTLELKNITYGEITLYVDLAAQSFKKELEVNNYISGLWIRNGDKKTSINDRIENINNYMNNDRLYILDCNKVLIKQMEDYSTVIKAQKIIPSDKDNDLIDAMFYSFSNIWYN